MKFDVDKSLSRLSHVSQILLVGFAIFGYFYTVRPIYQKEVLSENIAQKELQLSKLNLEKETVYKQIAEYEKKEKNLLSSIESLQGQTNKIKNELQTTEYELNTAKNELGKTKNDLVLAEGKVTEKTNALIKLEKLQRKGMSDIYFENFSGIVSRHYLKEGYSLIVDKIKPQKTNISELKKRLESPYVVISKSLKSADHDFLKANKNVPEKLREEVIKYIIRNLERDKIQLDRDYSKLIEKLNKSVIECTEKTMSIKDKYEKIILNSECDKQTYDLISEFHKENMEKTVGYVDTLRANFK